MSVPSVPLHDVAPLLRERHRPAQDPPVGAIRPAEPRVQLYALPAAIAALRDGCTQSASSEWSDSTHCPRTASSAEKPVKPRHARFMKSTVPSGVVDHAMPW